MQDVIVLSAYNRGFWLAEEMKKMGLTVSLIDLTSSLGNWSTEDIDGPFGLWKSDKMTTSQFYRWSQTEDSDRIHEGLCVWFPDGPWESTGPVSASHPKTRELRSDLIQLLHTGQGFKKIANRSYDQLWLAHMSNSISHTLLLPYPDSLKLRNALSIFSSHYTRRLTRRGLQKSAEILSQSGVTYITAQTLNDLRRDTGEVAVDNKTKPAKLIISFLSREEIKYLNPDLCVWKKTTAPNWAWARYRIKLHDLQIVRALPKHFMYVEDIRLPLTHSHMMILCHTYRENEWDMWMRLPYHRCSDPNFIQQQSEEALQKLKQRFPKMDVSCLEIPKQEIKKTPTPFPHMHFEDQLAIEKKEKFWLCGPETWDRMDAGGEFEQSLDLLNKVKEQFFPEPKKKKFPFFKGEST